MNSSPASVIPEVEPGFVSALLAEDELGAVVRSHIYVESRLNEYLDLVTSRPEHLAEIGLRFRQKVQLACALGFDPDFLKPLVALGELRNKFAHKLNTSLTDTLVDRLYAALPPVGKQAVDASFSRTRAQLKTEGNAKLANLPPRDRFILITLTLERVVFAGGFLVQQAQPQQRGA
jgi:hypothetical protein